MVPSPTTGRGELLRPDGVPTLTGPGPAWVREHLPAVLRYAARRLPLDDAEDVAAEAAAALLEAERAGRAPDVPGAYLLGVARRRIADRLRRHARGHVPVALPEGWEGLCDLPLPDEALASRELALLVEVAWALLPAEGRMLLAGRYREGASLVVLAQRLSTPAKPVTAKAVEGRLTRARATLRELLLEAGAGALEVVSPEGEARVAGRGTSGERTRGTDVGKEGA